MGLKWFMSYVKVHTDGSVWLGQRVYEENIHPLEKATQWDKGKNGGRITLVLSFQTVGEEIPESDLLIQVNRL